MRLAALSAGLALSCAGNGPARAPAAAGSCAGDYVLTGSPRHDVAQLGRRCAEPAGLRAVTEIVAAEQSAGAPAARFEVFVADRRACYWFAAVGGRGIQELDLALAGEEPGDVVGDVSGGPVAMLSPGGLLCPGATGRYVLEVAVQRGAGTWALQVWGDRYAR